MKKYKLITIIILVFASLFIITLKEEVNAASCQTGCSTWTDSYGCKHTCIANWCDADSDGANDDWGVCNESWDGSSCQPDSQCGGGTSTCSDSDPAAVNLLSPSNGATLTSSNVTLSWTPTSNWGKCCDGTHRHYYIYYRKKVSTCNAASETDANGTYSYSANKIENPNTVTQRSITVPSGETYCWFVQTWNKCVSKNSARREFTVLSPPIHSGTNIQANTCNSGYSGTSSQSGTDNPLTITSTYTHPEGVANIDQVSLAIIPNNVRNASPISETSAMDGSRYFFMGLVDINHTSPSSSSFYIVNDNSGSGAYNGTLVGDDLINNTNRSILHNINSTAADGTKVEIVNATTIRVHWRVEFTDTYPITTNNVYSAAFTQLANGNWLSSAYPTTYSRYLGKESNQTWGVDVVPPQTTPPEPIVLDSTTFSMDWATIASDDSPITDLEAYMWPRYKTLVLDKTNSPTATYTLGATEPPDFSPSNINVNETNYQRKDTYSVSTDIDPIEELNTKVVARDIACNTSSGTESLGMSDSWMITVGGDTHNTNTNINVLERQLDPPFGHLSSQDSFLSSYINSIEDSSRNLSVRLSKNLHILEGYNDWNDAPPKLSAQGDWYDYLLKLVQDNTGQLLAPTIPLAGTKTNQMIGASIYTKRHVLWNGNVTLSQNTVCNTQSIIFVNGDLTINPDLSIENNPSTGEQMGCMFIVKGNVNVTKGNAASQYTTEGVLGINTTKNTVQGEVLGTNDGACGTACNDSSDCMDYGTGGDRVECINGTCSNVLCPENDVPGTICNCNGVATCGEYCGYGGVGLCGDGISTCVYLSPLCPTGTLKTVCYPIARETPGSGVYDPAFDAQYSTAKCFMRDTGNSYINDNVNYTDRWTLYSSSFTQSDVQAMCNWCGNYKLDPGEECDPPGSVDNGYTCDTDCTLIPPEPTQPIPDVYYDNIQAFIFSNQGFTTSIDDRGDATDRKYDGLYLKGSIITSTSSFGRDLRLFNNARFPAEIIDYDARYSNIFREDLKSTRFSIREENYIKKITN